MSPIRAVNRLATFAVASALGLMLTGCRGGDSSASTSPASPSPSSTTDTFTGTVPVGGSDVHTFAVGQSGEVDVDLIDVDSGSTIAMGIRVGTLDGATCTLLPGASKRAQAGSASRLSGFVTAGTYCVEVFDAGNQTAAVVYTLTVTHL